MKEHVRFSGVLQLLLFFHCAQQSLVVSPSTAPHVYCSSRTSDRHTHIAKVQTAGPMVGSRLFVSLMVSLLATSSAMESRQDKFGMYSTYKQV